MIFAGKKLKAEAKAGELHLQIIIPTILEMTKYLPLFVMFVLKP